MMDHYCFMGEHGHVLWELTWKKIVCQTIPWQMIVPKIMKNVSRPIIKYPSYSLECA